MSIATPWILDLVTGPSGQVVSVQEMETFGYVVDTEQHGEMKACIDAAIEIVEAEGRLLLTQTWDVQYRRFPGTCGELVLPLFPLSSVTSVTYVDTAGDSQTWSSANYTVQDGSERAQPYIIPAYNAIYPATRGHDRDVTVRCVCGFGTADDIPPALKQQVKMLAHGLFRERHPEMCGSSGGRSMVYEVLSEHNRTRTMEFI